jgi:glycosyltransferase involved in cell wall biosynthesis
MKLSFLTHGFAAWGGGIDFIKTITSGVAAAAESAAIQKQIILPSADGDGGRTEAYFKEYFSDLSSSFELTVSGPGYVDQLKTSMEYGADVVLPCMYLPPVEFDKVGPPWVGYLFDFQHRYYPRFFTEPDRRSRDYEAAWMLYRPAHVITNGQAVNNDAVRFFGEFPAKVHVLPCCPSAQPNWLESDEDIRARYGLDRPYFMICNQFWIHKDHGTAFRAFAQFVRGGGDALLVCTGQVTDYRFPEYFGQLQALIVQLGVESRVRILGRIPKLDQVNLIKTAIAMLQPTLFEGGPGGGAAYDAIALGIPVIASDIPINLELDVGEVAYFKAGNAEALSEAMLARFGSPYKRPDNATLLEQGLERRRRCGQMVLEVARQSIRQ